MRTNVEFEPIKHSFADRHLTVMFESEALIDGSEFRSASNAVQPKKPKALVAGERNSA